MLAKHFASMNPLCFSLSVMAAPSHWTFSEDALREHTPSRAQGVLAEVEDDIRMELCQLIDQVARHSELKLYV